MSCEKYCAVYTRKSSDDGLRQDFNSLDAQQEACLAYIASQKSKGWVAVQEYYADGGFSGGNMERPALKKLIEDIKAGKIHIVVVYKIDRLTRSLMDFCKLMEVFDKEKVTFVSVTQSFNTTTSMGRLTLNMLLSFAQFEREITSERIRDKKEASQKKGMWAGGYPPLGYDLRDKRLHVNQEEAVVVRRIFESYLKLGSIGRLQGSLEKKGVMTKRRISSKGRQSGGKPFDCGTLYRLLRNPIFIGKVRHKGATYEGLHAAVISLQLWHRVHRMLARQMSPPRRKWPSVEYPLKGKLFDMDGNAYKSFYAVKHGRRYDYYVSQALKRWQKSPLARLPAYEMDSLVENGIKNHLPDFFHLNYGGGAQLSSFINGDRDLFLRMRLLQAVQRVNVSRHNVGIDIDINTLQKEIEEIFGIFVSKKREDNPSIVVSFHIRRDKYQAVFMEREPQQNKEKEVFNLPPAQLRDLVRGIVWRDEYFGGMTATQIAGREKCSVSVVLKLIHKSLETASS